MFQVEFQIGLGDYIDEPYSKPWSKLDRIFVERGGDIREIFKKEPEKWWSLQDLNL
jgi:hypothetical protein